MTGNSIILVEYTKESNNGVTLSSYGCSEFVAMTKEMLRYTTICLPILNDFSTVKKYVAVDGIAYMEEWVRFVYTAFECMNVDSDPFIKLYTIGDFKKQFPAGHFGNSVNMRTLKDTDKLSYDGREYTVSDDTVIGITVEVKAMRKYFKNESSNIRKVQMTHTALRYAWSQAWRLAVIATNLAKVAPTVDKLHLLHAADFLRKKVCKEVGFDYGSLHVDTSKLVTKDKFVHAFLDTKVQGVQQHFSSEDSALIKMVFSQEKLSLDALLSFNGVTVKMDMVATPTAEYGEFVTKVINDNLRSSGLDDVKVIFTFEKTIFKSTAPNVKYTGYKKKGNVMDRILFEDEEQTILSIPLKSNLIKIL